MSWQDKCGDKLVSLDQAVGTIRSGNVVHVAPYSTTPMTLCIALQNDDAHCLFPVAFVSTQFNDLVDNGIGFRLVEHTVVLSFSVATVNEDAFKRG